MKKIILIAASLLTFTGVVNAQITQTADGTSTAVKSQLTIEQRAQKAVDELNSTLTLTPEQKTKVLALATTKVKGLDVVTEKYKNDPEKNNKSWGENQSVKKQFAADLKALLTPAQLEKLNTAGPSLLNKD